MFVENDGTYYVWLIFHQEPHSKHVWMVQIALNPTVLVVKIHSTTGGLNFEILISGTYLEYLCLNELKLLLNKMNLCYHFFGLCFGNNWKKKHVISCDFGVDAESLVLLVCELFCVNIMCSLK